MRIYYEGEPSTCPNCKIKMDWKKHVLESGSELNYRCCPECNYNTANKWFEKHKPKKKAPPVHFHGKGFYCTDNPKDTQMALKEYESEELDISNKIFRPKNPYTNRRKGLKNEK